MNRRSRLVIVGVALSLLVGAGVYVFVAGQNTHSSARYLDVEPAEGNVSANETVAFEALSPGQQALFERARNSTDAVEIPPEVSDDVFIDNRYIRYRNRTYETSVLVGD